MKKFNVLAPESTNITQRSLAMSSSKKPALISSFTALFCLAVVSLTSAAQSYNVVGDFSSSSNPNGPWSYGWTSTLGSAFNLETLNTNNYAGIGLSGWLFAPANVNSGVPYVLYNGTANPITNNTFTVYQPGQLAQHPGTNLLSVIRWTAPFSGSFSIAATFSGVSALGDSVDVHILHNGTSIFNSTVIGSPSPAPYSGIESIVTGDTIDFVVGHGANGFNEDTTALTATIVPEPTTLGLVGMSFACLALLRFFKRKQ